MLGHPPQRARALEAEVGQYRKNREGKAGLRRLVEPVVDRLQPVRLGEVIGALPGDMGQHRAFKAGAQIVPRQRRARQADIAQGVAGEMFGPTRRPATPGPASRRPHHAQQQQRRRMAQILRHPPRREPAAVPAQPRSRRRHGDDRRQQQQLDQGEHPFVGPHPQRQVGEAHHHRQRRHYEVDDHPAAIGIGQPVGDAIGPGVHRHDIIGELVGDARITSRHGAGYGDHLRPAAFGNRPGRFVDDLQRAEPVAPAKHPLDPAIEAEQAARSRTPAFTGEQIGAPPLHIHGGADDRLQPFQIGGGIGIDRLAQFLGPAENAPAFGTRRIDQQHRSAHRQRGHNRVTGAAGQIGDLAVPHRDDQIGPLDHHLAGKGDIVRHQRLESAGSGVIAGRGEAGAPQRLDLGIAVGDFEQRGRGGDPADRGGLGLDRGIARRPPGQQRIDIRDGAGMGIDRAVERRSEGQRHGKVPATREADGSGDLVGSVHQQAVQPHRPAFIGQALADRVDLREQRLQRGSDRARVGREGRIGGAVPGDPERKVRLPAVADQGWLADWHRHRVAPPGPLRPFAPVLPATCLSAGPTRLQARRHLFDASGGEAHIHRDLLGGEDRRCRTGCGGCEGRWSSLWD